MKWSAMTAGQKQLAYRLRDDLHKAGLPVTTMQVVIHFDRIKAWQRGDLTDELLLAETGWTRPQSQKVPAGPTGDRALRAGDRTDTCYATYEELEPEDLQASRVSGQATDHHQES